MKKALKIGDVAVNVVASSALATSFHPEIAQQFIDVPDEVETGWIEVEGVWQAPPTANPEPSTAAIVVDVPTFFMLFTIAEEAAIRASQDPGVRVLIQRLDHPATKAVNLSLQANIAAINYLAAQGLITEARAAEILTGQVS